MKFSIAVDHIPLAGTTLEGKLEAEWLRFALGDALTVGEGPFPLTLAFHRQGHNVTVDGEFSLEVSFDCSRCAETAAERVEVPIRLAYAEGLSSQGGENEEEETTDIGVWGIEADRVVTVYEGPTIDVERELNEQIVLALPTWPLCREDCRGLCTMCGRDLNKESCACVEESVDPRWAKLKDFKLGG